jgi:hypothetical protein
MGHARHVDEVVARVTATFAFYRREDGQWGDQPELPRELDAAVAVINGLSRDDKTVRPRFFRVLESELTARYGMKCGRELAVLVRTSSHAPGKAMTARP